MKKMKMKGKKIVPDTGKPEGVPMKRLKTTVSTYYPKI